ncbi:transcription factor MYB36-like [Hordeum vulgare subsp. vulgare]|uniref:Uncharacterized protein n=1 Tax=Hordeum vulgare subsp. vulgare TaxID=112509 RepID=A0A8I6Y849_HORVV|nr:transcription factor MYB36-like [Hordeum vulgare subsp. vulgare]
MGRAPCCDKATVKKGPWSPEEDAKLKAYIDENGTGGNWIALPQKIGLKRCGKSCRLRWLNYLRPNIKHGDFTEEEEHIICSLYISIGSRWSIIAAQLPGRTDNDIKNYWNTKLKKKLLGKRAPSRRLQRTNQDGPMPYSYLAAGGAGGGGSSSGVNANGTTAALSSSALERIQLHMRLQGLYSAFGNAPPQWPKLEPPTDAVAMTTVGHGHSLAAGAVVQAEQQINPSAGASYDTPAPGSFEERSSKLGFGSPAGESAGMASTVEMSSGSMVGGSFGYGHVDELYDFLYNKQLAAAGAFQGGVPPLPELQCPDGGAVVGADEKFSTWMASTSCDHYVPTTGGQLQLQGGNSMSLQDFVLGYDQ